MTRVFRRSPSRRQHSSREWKLPDPVGTYEELDALSRYAAYLHEIVPVPVRRRLKSSPMPAMAWQAIPCRRCSPRSMSSSTPMYFELDGTSPTTMPTRSTHSTLVDLQARVVEIGADIGLAFDGDADRCFVVGRTW